MTRTLTWRYHLVPPLLRLSGQTTPLLLAPDGHLLPTPFVLPPAPVSSYREMGTGKWDEGCLELPMNGKHESETTCSLAWSYCTSFSTVPILIPQGFNIQEQTICDFYSDLPTTYRLTNAGKSVAREGEISRARGFLLNTLGDNVVHFDACLT